MTPVLAPARITAAQLRWQEQTRQQLNFLRAQGLTRVYGPANHWNFLSGRQVLVADPVHERMAEVAREVDAAPAIAWTFPRPSAAFEATATAAGLRYRRLDGPNLVAYTDFQVDPVGLADLEPAGWTATASSAPEHARFALDRLLDTVWGSREAQAPGQTFQVDLGRVEWVGALTWLPQRFDEVPSGFRVLVSEDGARWHEVRRVPEYGGPLYRSVARPMARPRRSRVEVRFPPRPARHLRIELLAPAPRPWTIRELLVGTPAGRCDQPVDVGVLVARLRATGVSVAYADHWPSAAIAHATAGAVATLPSNSSRDSYRWVWPPLEEVEPLRLRRRAPALVVEGCPPARADAVAAQLTRAGLAFRRDTVGGFAVFSLLRRPASEGHRVRWRPEAPGRLLVTQDAAGPTGTLTLSCAAPIGEVRPPLLELATGPDGFAPRAFRIRAEGRLHLVGPWLFEDAPTRLVLTFPPAPWRAARLTWPGTDTPCPVSMVRAGPAPGEGAG